MTTNSTLRDIDLIEKALAGQEDCFDLLMQRHVVAIRRCLHVMIHSPSDREDLFQETFFKSWRYLSTFRADSSFRTWIVKIAINEARGLYRRRRIDRIVPVPLEEIAIDDASPREALARLEACHIIRTAIQGMPERYRRVLVLRDLHELSTVEVARQLDAGVSLVKTRLSRARKMLSKEVERPARMRRARLCQSEL